MSMDFLRRIFSSPVQHRHGVVALLDDASNAYIRDLWQQLDDECGIKHLFDDPLPHITHLQVEDIQRDDLKAALRTFGQQQAPYTVQTSGIGIFTGERIAVYVSVVRSSALDAAHDTLTEYCAPLINGMSETHLITNWVPHITLMLPEAVDDRLPEVIRFLSQQQFRREMTVTGVALLDSSQTDSDSDSHFTVTLNGDD